MDLAEELIFDDITTGASQDIKQATAYAKSMVTKFGMSEALGLCTVITFINDPLHFTVDRCSNLFTITSGGMTKISSDKYFIIIISIAYKTIIKEHEAVLYKCADLLLEKEKITREEFEALFEE